MDISFRLPSLFLIIFIVLGVFILAANPNEHLQYWNYRGEGQNGGETTNEDEEKSYSFESVQELLNKAMEAQQMRFISSTEIIREIVEKEMRAIVASPSEVSLEPKPQKKP